MLRATEDERQDVIRYYLSQSPEGTTVSFLQKVYSEAVIGHRHDVWDVHTSDGRWWVITNPTNLYSQDQFPHIDLAITFHLGLCLRIPRSQENRNTGRSIIPFGSIFVTLSEAKDAVGQADSVSDYQTIGVRSREALLAWIAAAQDSREWPGEDHLPKRADFRAWAEIICNAILPGAEQKERRQFLKGLLADTWTFTNWLTHSKSATWLDAEAAITTVEHVLSLATFTMVRHLRHVPDQCPKCGSPTLSPEEGLRKDLPEVVWERPVCADCGWSGTPVAVDVRDKAEAAEIITREGGDESDNCATMEVPLTGLRKPVDAS